MFEVSLSSKVKVAKDGAPGFDMDHPRETVLPINSKFFHQGLKAAFVCSEEEKQFFPSSKSVLVISVGQPAHEEKKLAATIELMNKTFVSCDVAVCDSLQRYTIQINSDQAPESAYLQAQMAGEAWIERNREWLELLRIPHRIFRWNEYLMHPDFQACHEKIISAYQQSEVFKKEMDETIKEFIERYQHRSIEIDTRKAFDCCFNYLSEECAIMTLMWPRSEYNYMVYPSNMPRVFKAAHDQFVLPIHPGLLQWLRIRFRT